MPLDGHGRWWENHSSRRILLRWLLCGGAVTEAAEANWIAAGFLFLVDNTDIIHALFGGIQGRSMIDGCHTGRRGYV